MAALTTRQAEKNLLDIILSVESGTLTPEQALDEQSGLLQQAPEGFKAGYTLEDFQRIRTEALSKIDYDLFDLDDMVLGEEFPWEKEEDEL